MAYWLFFENRWHRNYFIRRYLYGPGLALLTRTAYLLRFLIPKRCYRLERPVFVVGCSRSGTTMFIEHFARHPELCDWSEAAQVMALDFYNERIDHLKEAADLTPFDAFRIRLLFGGKTWLTGRRRFVNKHPENSLRMRWIKAIFPDARFIHMYRDGRAVTASNYVRTEKDPFRRRWPFGQFPKPPSWREYLALPLEEQFAHQWLDVTRYIQEVAADLGDEEYCEISYERFCERPAEVLRELDAFCGIDPERRPADAVPESFTPRNDKWRKLFDDDQVARIEALLGELNERLGYPREGRS